MKQIKIETNKKREVIDITENISNELSKDTKLVNVFVTHSTAALATAELDPGSDQDYLDAYEKLIPKLKYRHPHDPEHMPDHILSTTIGASLTIPVINRKLALGTWQRLVLIEFDGPRLRNILITEL